ncbi:MAG: protein glxC, partial [Betaproteobacteria bacterium]|nr:protein glxC [Betaproteobacteria bacterium]
MASVNFDLAQQSLRTLNQYLHSGLPVGPLSVAVHNPDGAHSIAVGVNAPIDIDIHGHAGYYA